MARILLTLIAANLIAFLWLSGVFSVYAGGGRDPGRLAQQVDPDRLRILKLPDATSVGSASANRMEGQPGSAANASATPANTFSAEGGSARSSVANPADSGSAAAVPGPHAVAGQASGASSSAATSGSVAAGSGSAAQGCYVLTQLDSGNLTRLKAFLAEHSSVFTIESEIPADLPQYLVYTLPVEDMAAAQRKLTDFKRQNFENIAIIGTGRYRFGMSFGTHPNEDGARAQIESLSARGVRNLRIGRVEQSPAVGELRYRFLLAESSVPASLRERYAAVLAAGSLSPRVCTP